MRTLPLVSPLNASLADGIFLDGRLASDDEPERRVWKMTVRTDNSRGEQVYQSQFEIPRGSDSFKRIEIPFDSFRLVRGPRLIVGGPPLNTTGGLYQIGMTMSKFLMNENTTMIENFRPGFFDLHLERIGFFSNDSPSTVSSTYSSKSPITVQTLSKKDANKKRPLILKLLLPIAKLFFSEKANRRRSAMKILREKRGMSREKAIIYGIKSRAKARGLVASIFKTGSILSVDVVRAVAIQVLKVCFLLPIRVFRKAIRWIQKYVLRMKLKELPTLE